MSAPRATEAAIRRALAAWKDAGLQVGRMEISKDGDITIVSAAAVSEPVKPSAPRQWSRVG